LLPGRWPAGLDRLTLASFNLMANRAAKRAALMLKSELVRRILDQKPPLRERDVENIVNAILGEIIQALARGDRVEIRYFGSTRRAADMSRGFPPP
jgi:hypothetical protein